MLILYICINNIFLFYCKIWIYLQTFKCFENVEISTQLRHLYFKGVGGVKELF